MERRVGFLVPDIRCEGCAQHIHEELDDAPGIKEVDVSVPQKRVYVIFDPERITPEAVQQDLAEAGFPPEQMEPEAAEVRPTLTRVRPREPVAPLRAEARPSPQPSRTLVYTLLAVGVAILALAGYVGYELYPRFNLPAAEGTALLLLAAGAGIASFFSPCAFPLLVTLLARQTGVEVEAGRNRTGRALAFASALSVGTALFLLLVGIGISLGAGALFAGVTFTSTLGMSLRVVVGAILIVLGLVQLQILPTPLHVVERFSAPMMKTQARYRRKSPVMGFGLLGFGYVLAGIG